MPIVAEWPYVLVDFVQFDRIDKAAVAVRVQVVGVHEDALSAGGHSEWAYSCHDIADGVAFGEILD